MPTPDDTHLTRRERQIMDALYQRGRATAAEIREGLPDPPSYSAVRAMLVKLEAKGHVRHREQGPRYVYRPTVPRGQARRSAMHRLVDTFFDGSVASAVNGLLGMRERDLSAEDLAQLQTLLDEAKKHDA